ncbi:unnamed protein product [Lepidochelys kempii]
MSVSLIWGAGLGTEADKGTVLSGGLGEQWGPEGGDEGQRGVRGQRGPEGVSGAGFKGLGRAQDKRKKPANWEQCGGGGGCLQQILGPAESGLSRRSGEGRGGLLLSLEPIHPVCPGPGHPYSQDPSPWGVPGCPPQSCRCPEKWGRGNPEPFVGSSASPINHRLSLSNHRAQMGEGEGLVQAPPME